MNLQYSKIDISKPQPEEFELIKDCLGTPTKLVITKEVNYKSSGTVKLYQYNSNKIKYCFIYIPDKYLNGKKEALEVIFDKHENFGGDWVVKLE